jgi:26S proteasome regulatory subunit N5
MSDGALFKPERDYTKEADKVIPEAQVLAKVARSLLTTERNNTDTSQHDVHKAIDKILALEKQARQVSGKPHQSQSDAL